jgi:hypothetical protein
MSDAGKAVDGWFAEGAVDEQGVVVADKGEGDDANSFEDAGVNDD